MQFGPYRILTRLRCKMVRLPARRVAFVEGLDPLLGSEGEHPNELGSVQNGRKRRCHSSLESKLGGGDIARVPTRERLAVIACAVSTRPKNEIRRSAG